MASETIRGVWAVIALLEHLRDRLPLSREDRQFCVEALTETLESGFSVSLDQAFELRSQGGITPSTALLRNQRNCRLIGLWKDCPDWRALSASAAARAMHLSARQYEQNRWPRENKNLTAPAADPAATWWKILRSGAKIQATKQLERLFFRYEEAELHAKSVACDGHSNAL